MAESTPFDALFEYAMEVLAEGPLPLGALVERLDQAGRLDVLRADGLDDEDLPEAVLHTPDLVVLDWDGGDGLELADGSSLVHQPGAHVPGEDDAVLVGPDRAGRGAR
jgi:hypothetical protein